MTTPQGSMQTLYNIRPGDREQVSKLLNAIITASPGRLVLLRGLPPGVPPSIVEARLSRAYALVEPARWRVRCFNKAKESWDGIAVHPVMRLYTAYRAAGPSQWSIGEDSDHGVVGNRNNTWNVDQNHIDLDLANQDPDATATFLIRLRTSDDAQRLCRSFNRKTWDEVPRKAIRSKVRAILRHRRDFGSELPRFEEAAENDHDSASRQGDGGQEHGAEEVTEETSDGTKRMEPSEDQDSWSKEYTQLLARETESKRNARQYLVEAQIMY
ncbi:hypothetical protein BCV69DRAFT_298891 [Microstroma glucosiphilum]|uniref:Uncharacterized protein n=1 Tax=Pseudomicrostroma glucosiphilum TaxID=1684307 RepID=A0A316U796_9BASI|nr:hypothetical protein BCV69DRAFT_298891 [Pseudomicrostroma glucosiphilum]PWN21107.1 hypothetical protein BCV69DRAFT_298891 [Pseudomicrostroma glucosiphilum]